jgi:hypothetical protein
MKRIRILALITGLAVDLIGTTILSTALTFAFVAVRSASGQRPEAIVQTLARDPLFLVIGYAGGIVFTLLGAYITARMSRPYSTINTLLFGTISTVLIVFFASMYPLWYNILCVLTIIPLSLIPGYLVSRKPPP